ncbi:MAG: carboxypeptidase-like regulatory domain-containing protein [Pyrinomonadaceae bacterium]
MLDFTSACIMGDGGISTHGRVLDERGKPIKGALVTLVSRDAKDESFSGDDGAYDVGVIHAPVKPIGKLIASKAGYQTYEKTFNSRDELGPLKDIVLKTAVTPETAR